MRCAKQRLRHEVRGHMNEADGAAGGRRVKRAIERGVADIVAGIVGELRGNAGELQGRQNGVDWKRRGKPLWSSLFTRPDLGAEPDASGFFGSIRFTPTVSM